MNQKLKSTAVWAPLVIAVTFITGMIAGNYFSHRQAGGSVERKISDIITLIQSDYVDAVDTDSLLEKTIPDLLSKLDPHTVYIPASELTSTNEVLEGSFGGIGVVFNMMTDTATVVEVVSGGPAEKVGMLAGDRILTVNDTLVAGVKYNMDKLRSRLKGPKGTVVRLGVKRASAPNMLTFDVTRGDIPVTSIDAAYLITPTTGYVRINKFGRNTYMEFLNSMIDLRSKGAESYILDLRDTTGVTSYYVNAFNAGMLHNFAFNFADNNRTMLEQAKTTGELLAMLPPDDTLLTSFVGYAQQKAGIAPRWYYINISRQLIVNQLKSLIASDILGQAALFEVNNMTDPSVARAIDELKTGPQLTPAAETADDGTTYINDDNSATD